MGIVETLFIPSGRIRGKDYWIGCAVLLIAAVLLQYGAYQMILSAEGVAGMMMGSMVSILLWLLIYPYFCLFGKRLHDIGAPATWFILIIFLYAIANWIVQLFVTLPAMFGEDGAMTQQMEMMENMTEAQESGDMTAIFESQAELQKQLLQKTYIPMLIAGSFVTLFFDFIMGILKPKTENNQYGDYEPDVFD